MRDKLSQVGLSVRSTAEYKVFNGLRASLGSAASNKFLIQSMPSVKTAQAVTKTSCSGGPFAPSQSVWLKTDNKAGMFRPCGAFVNSRPKLQIKRTQKPLEEISGGH